MSNQLNGYIKIKDFGRDRLYPTVNDLKRPCLSSTKVSTSVSFTKQSQAD